MQRATGVVGFLFVAFHVAAIRVPALIGHLAPADFFPKLTDDLSSTTRYGVPAFAMAYLLGLAATSYHLANGLSRFFQRLPVSENPRTRRAVSLACTMVGSALFLLGANTVVYFATGASLIGKPGSAHQQIQVDARRRGWGPVGRHDLAVFGRTDHDPPMRGE